MPDKTPAEQIEEIVRLSKKVYPSQTPEQASRFLLGVEYLFERQGIYLNDHSFALVAWAEFGGLDEGADFLELLELYLPELKRDPALFAGI